MALTLQYSNVAKSLPKVNILNEHYDELFFWRCRMWRDWICLCSVVWDISFFLSLNWPVWAVSNCGESMRYTLSYVFYHIFFETTIYRLRISAVRDQIIFFFSKTRTNSSQTKICEIRGTSLHEHSLPNSKWARIPYFEWMERLENEEFWNFQRRPCTLSSPTVPDTPSECTHLRIPIW